MGKSEKNENQRRFWGRTKQFWNDFRGKEQKNSSIQTSARKVGKSDTVTITSKPPPQTGNSLETIAPDLSSAKVSEVTSTDSGLWQEAADSLEPSEREKLDSLVQENQRASKNGTEDLKSGNFGLELVLSRASDLKDRENEPSRTQVVDKIINSALVFKSLGDAVVGFDKSGYAALGWSVVSFGLQLAANAKDMRNFVLSSSAFVTSFLVKYREYEKIRGSFGGEAYDDRLVKVYRAILHYELALNDYLRQSAMERLGRAGCKVDGRSLSQCEKAIRIADADVKDWIQIIMVKSNNKTSLLIQRIIDQTSPNLSHPSHECRKSLAFPEMDDRSNDIEKPAEGTCRWLITHDTYRDWLACNRSLLWIKGKPGSGKSTLLRYALDDAIVASNIQDKAHIQHCKESLGNTETIGAQPETSALILSFFFHGRGVELQRTPLGLFRSLLYQLLGFVPDTLSDLVATFEAKKTSMGAPGEKWHWHQNELVDFLKLSIEEVSKTRPVWLFVDALDECGKENANKLVEGFESLLRGCPSTAQFRICFSCRHYPILRLTYENALEICTERENEGDISTYVHAQLSTSTSEVPDTIEKTIRDRASGVFMWARLVVERVLDLELEGEGWKSIEDEIDKIPDELDGLYSGLIQSMKDKSSSLKLIQWICFALRPLSLEELQWALIVEADCSYTSLRQYGDKSKYVTNMENRLKTLSCGLAEVVPVIHARPVVQFIHQSVKDFFRKKGLFSLHQSQSSAEAESQETYSQEAYLEGTAHHRLSRICICYFRAEEIAQSIPIADSKSDYEDPREKLRIEELTSTFPLLLYAADSWIEHAIQGQRRGIVQDNLLDYMGWPSEAVIQLCTRIYRQLRVTQYGYGIEHFPRFGTTMLHLASRFGLKGPMEVILRSRDHVAINATDEFDATALHHAVLTGQTAAVNLLLGCGADVNTQGERSGSVLQAASREGHEHIVQILLGYGADVNAPGGYYDSALHEASRAGHAKIVRILLEHGADINALDVLDSNALTVASGAGHEEVVRILLGHGAHIDAKPGMSTTALETASLRGYEQIVRILLEHGADINSQGEFYNNAIEAAFQGGQEQIAQILLESGGELRAPRKAYSNALQGASRRGWVDVVRIILEKMGTDKGRIEFNASDKSGATALFTAARMGQRHLVKYLLQLPSVDTKIKNSSEFLQRGLLFYAVMGGDEAILHEVLPYTDVKGVNWRDHYGMTPLAVAVARKNYRTVEILLRDPMVNFEQDYNRDILGRSLLWWARSTGDEELEETLVQEALHRSISLDDDEVPVFDTRGENWWGHDGSFCHLCTRDVLEVDRLGCELCLPDSEFLICLDCFLLGGRCLNEFHVLQDRRPRI